MLSELIFFLTATAVLYGRSQTFKRLVKTCVSHVLPCFSYGWVKLTSSVTSNVHTLFGVLHSDLLAHTTCQPLLAGTHITYAMPFDMPELATIPAVTIVHLEELGMHCLVFGEVSTHYTTQWHGAIKHAVCVQKQCFSSGHMTVGLFG